MYELCNQRPPDHLLGRQRKLGCDVLFGVWLVFHAQNKSLVTDTAHWMFLLCHWTFLVYSIFFHP